MDYANYLSLSAPERDALRPELEGRDAVGWVLAACADWLEEGRCSPSHDHLQNTLGRYLAQALQDYKASEVLDA